MEDKNCVWDDCFLLHTAFTTGELIKVKPTKVVAGHEAERTNEFLQILSITILKEVQCTIMYFVSGVSPHTSLISNLLLYYIPQFGYESLD
jgi:hypothetical protein